MKTYKYLAYAALALTSLFSCEDEYEAPSDFADVSWYTSSKSDYVMHLAEREYYSFMDLSQNELSHKWIVTADSVDGEFAFLGGPIPAKPDSIETYINPDMIGLSDTKDKTVHVLFQKAGTYKVRLYNTFDRPVTYKGDSILESVFENGAYVIDTAFTVRCFGDLEPEYALYSDELHENLIPTGVDANGDTLNYEIEAGGKIYAVDMTQKDNPTGRTWICKEAYIPKPTDSVSVLSFSALGNTMITLQSIRTGDNFPEATENLKIPLKINVIKSSIPFEPQVGNELENEIIEVSFNGEVDAESLIGKEQDFSMRIFNKDANYDELVPINKITVLESNKTILQFKMATPIYATDSLRLNYTPGENGAILSTDQREMQPFENKWVKMFVHELCTDPVFKFDGAKAMASWAADWDNGFYYEMVKDPAATDSTRLGNSLMVDMTKNTVEGKGAFKITCKQAFETMKANTPYQFSYSIYTPSTTELHKSATVRIMVPYNWGDVKQCWADYSKAVDDDWTTITQTIEFTEDKIGRSFSLQVNQTEVNGIIYYDDFSIIKIEARPIK